mmetsp:Transcript_32573/g.31810  ORF Transcript_32573/g.31810 Transcript_32573/m.31810 type:complete len:93 (+) Transcript_32573:114-392(+)
MDIHWAVFNIIELMGSNSFQHKRIAFVIAPLIFKDGKNSDFLTLVPNLFRKDLMDISRAPHTASISLTCMSRICNEDIAQLLYKDLIPLFSC